MFVSTAFHDHPPNFDLKKLDMGTESAFVDDLRIMRMTSACAPRKKESSAWLPLAYHLAISTKSPTSGEPIPRTTSSASSQLWDPSGTFQHALPQKKVVPRLKATQLGCGPYDGLDQGALATALGADGCDAWQADISLQPQWVTTQKLDI